MDIKGKVTIHQSQNKIYHHKWLFGTDDYSGFDVAESKARSTAWMRLANVDRLRIGDRTYWEREVVPRLISQ